MSSPHTTPSETSALHLPATDPVSGRDFVARMAALSAVWMTAASCARDPVSAADSAKTASAMPHMTQKPASPPQLLHFSALQAVEIDAIASRIIPTDDTVGAHEAGSLYFIDNTLTTFAKEQAPLFDEGLRTLAKAVKAKHGVAQRSQV